MKEFLCFILALVIAVIIGPYFQESIKKVYRDIFRNNKW